MAVLIPVHAAGAVIALLLGGYNLRHRPRGDRLHRRVGLAWAIAMYWTVLSSFAIRELRPGQFSWIHGLSVFTFVTLTIGLWGARTGRAKVHRQFVTGSYFGLVGAFIGAVAVPQRWLPQLALHHPFLLLSGLAGCALVAAAVITMRRPPVRPKPRVTVGASGRPTGARRRTAEGVGAARGAADPRPADPRPADPRPANPRPAGDGPANPRPAGDGPDGTVSPAPSGQPSSGPPEDTWPVRTPSSFR